MAGKICLIAVTFLSCVHGQPMIISTSDTLRVYAGQAAILECLHYNLGNSMMRWSFVSHNFVIFEGTQLMTDNKGKYSLIHRPGGQQYHLQILNVEKTDQGFYKCAIEGTDQQIITHLKVIDMPDMIEASSPPMNMTDCCLEEEVTESCLPGCYPPDVNLQVFNATARCGTVRDLRGLSKCFTAGSNHDNCCLNAGVDHVCLDFCHNGVPENLTAEYYNKCFTENVIVSVFTCFEVGFEYLPGEPTEVAALAVHGEAFQAILVKWSEPRKNPQSVVGYKIMYKPRDQETYFSRVIKDPKARQYQLTADKDKILPGVGYKIHISALADHGVSFGSIEVDIYVPDFTKVTSQNTSISTCCSSRGVSGQCRDLLCLARTWSHFNVDHVLDCYPELEDIFTCLVGERNHTNCCAAFDVTPECLPLCSGQPPAFDISLIGCVSQMSIIEACVQQGYDTLPGPPTQVTVSSVEYNSAVIKFQPSASPDLSHYLVGVQEGSEQSLFIYNITVGVTEHTVYLDDLRDNTYYWVQIISVGTAGDSLPSETVSFLTYPVGYSDPTPDPVTNLPHNMTDCCRNTNMPEECWKGCVYRENITSYYKTRLGICFNHIGSVLACAADGRDHSECCRSHDIQPVCVELCAHTKKGPLALKYITCVPDTAKAIVCYQEGIVDLPRHPDVVVTSVSKNSISLSWMQPNTSGLIDEYIISYGTLNSESKSTISTNKTFFILQDLVPGKAYEISITSSNSNGTSAPSPTITQYTLADDVQSPTYNTTEVSGRALWQNISHCCENNVREECLEQCLDKRTTFPQYDTCVNESTKMLACFADGKDHRLCCEKKALPSVCRPICGGHAVIPDIGTATCMSYAYREIILSCFLENKGLVPGAPGKFTAKLTSEEGFVELQWSPSKKCDLNCTYDVHYWKAGDYSNTNIISDISNKSLILQVETENHYTFAVTAHNEYGSGVPSAWQTLFIPQYEKNVRVYLVGEDEWVEQGQSAKLLCALNGFNPNSVIRLEWFFNYRRKLDNSGKKELFLNNVESTRDEGVYTCSVTDSSISSSNSLFLPVKYIPLFSHLEDKSAKPGIGETARIECLFSGIPNFVPHTWFKDWKLLIPAAGKNLMHFLRNDDTGLTSYMLEIENVVEEDYGMYSLNVSNNYGSAECHVNLTNPENHSIVAPISKITDPQQCCKTNDVSTVCQEICVSNIDVGSVISNPRYSSCGRYFRTYIACGADGRDHSKCCQQQGVLPFCVPLCSGVVPEDLIANQLKLLQCLGEAPVIITCEQEGHKLLPFSPTNVSLSFVENGRSILVRWSKPSYMQDKVDHYTIYYNYSGNPAQKQINVNELVTEYYIRNVLPQTVYYVWMTAGNKNGYSQPTTILKIKTSETTGTDGDTEKQITNGDSSSNKVAIGVGVTLGIITLIGIVLLILFIYRRRLFPPRENNAVTFENPGFGTQGQVKIQGTEEQYSYGRLQEEGSPAVSSSHDTCSTGDSATDTSYENPMYQIQQSNSLPPTASLPGESKS